MLPAVQASSRIAISAGIQVATSETMQLVECEIRCSTLFMNRSFNRYGPTKPGITGF